MFLIDVAGCCVFSVRFCRKRVNFPRFGGELYQVTLEAWARCIASKQLPIGVPVGRERKYRNILCFNVFQ